mgnify:CR=1 FL=1
MQLHLTRLLLFILTVSPAVLRTMDKDPPKPEKLKAELVQDDWSGIYYVSGKHKTEEYRGAVVLRTVREIYVADFSIAGFPQFQAIGFRHGDTITLGWVAEGKEHSMRGVHAMKRKGEGFAGHWISVPGAGFAQEETWEFLKPLK